MVTSFPISYLFIQEINKKKQQRGERDIMHSLKKIIELTENSSQNNTVEIFVNFEPKNLTSQKAPALFLHQSAQFCRLNQL